MAFLCRGGLRRSAASPEAAEGLLRKASGEQGREVLSLFLSTATLVRSFATVGGMDPYVVVEADGEEVHRARAYRWRERGTFLVDAVFVLRSSGVPSRLTVSVRSANPWGRDVLCGAVELPWSATMEPLLDFEAPLTKRGQATGALRLSLKAMRRPALPIDLGSGAQAETGAPAEEPPPPTLLSPLRKRMGTLKAATLGVINLDSFEVEPAVAPGTSLGAAAETLAQTEQEATEEAVEEALAALLGSWTCVATEGLDEFLRATGIGALQRRLAAAARWPSWDFLLEDGRLVFVNHSAMGLLREEMPLDASVYTHRDGRGNLVTSSARWARSADGGVLTNLRKAAIGACTEERRVTGDTLEFVLTNDAGVSWGRTFRRA